jgi:hypothetical protein
VGLTTYSTLHFQSSPKNNFNIIHTSYSRYSKWTFSKRLPHQNSVRNRHPPPCRICIPYPTQFIAVQYPKILDVLQQPFSHQNQNTASVNHCNIGLQLLDSCSCLATCLFRPDELNANVNVEVMQGSPFGLWRGLMK